MTTEILLVFLKASRAYVFGAEKTTLNFVQTVRSMQSVGEQILVKPMIPSLQRGQHLSQQKDKPNLYF